MDMLADISFISNANTSRVNITYSDEEITGRHLSPMSKKKNT